MFMASIVRGDRHLHAVEDRPTTLTWLNGGGNLSAAGTAIGENFWDLQGFKA